MAELKYFRTGRTQTGYGEETGIILDDCDDAYDRYGVFSISRDGDKVVFYEECDGYYFRECSKAEAIEILQEAIAWVEENG